MQRSKYVAICPIWMQQPQLHPKKFHKTILQKGPVVLAFNDECRFLVAIFFRLQHNEALKLASKGVRVLVVMYPIVTH